jgi:holo-[acyl-carrier protein] synthase
MRIIGHGIDAVDVSRIVSLMEKHPERFLERVFTPQEQERGEGGRRHAEHLAGRFAAKEAVLKALGTGLTAGIHWKEVEVITQASGAPTLLLTGQAETIAYQRGITRWHVSITHTDSLAIASVIGEG